MPHHRALREGRRAYDLASMAYQVRGILEVNEHCQFPFEEREGVMHRTVHLKREHCARCIAHLTRLAYRCAFRLIDDRREAAPAAH